MPVQVNVSTKCIIVRLGRTLRQFNKLSDGKISSYPNSQLGQSYYPFYGHIVPILPPLINRHWTLYRRTIPFSSMHVSLFAISFLFSLEKEKSF